MPAPFLDGSVTITTAGVRKRFSVSSIKFDWLDIAALKTNQGSVFAGSTLVATGRGKILEPGDTWPVPVPESEQIDVSEIWGDADTSGDKFSWIGGWGKRN